MDHPATPTTAHLSRRDLFRGGAALGLGALLARTLSAADSPSVAEVPDAALAPTVPEIEGPFHPVVAQHDTDADLTRVEGRNDFAQGTAVWLAAQVVDTTGAPIPGVSVDLWQANAAGRYRHPHDSNRAPLDPAFQGWALLQTDDNGRFACKTVIPGAYPVSRIWTRPPHIHLTLSRRGYHSLTTQLYFPEATELNGRDRLLQQHSAGEQAAVIGTPNGDRDGVRQLDWQLVLSAV